MDLNARILMDREVKMAKRIKIVPVVDILEDRFLTVEDVMNLLSCSSSHVYMLEKTGCIESIPISCSVKDNGQNIKRFSLVSIRNFIHSRREIQQEILNSQ